ncbi:MAG TPA: hypothetical protein VN695_16300 [Streptosporangiaceae bacterium]|nr:hypothetical protein [Streptosporangiaceae bacterium]
MALSGSALEYKPAVAAGSTRRARLAGSAALALIGGGVAAFAVVMVLGPSAAVPKINSAGPLLWLDACPPVGLVIALERLGALAGALGTVIGLAAAAGGWRPAPRLLSLFGVIAVTVFVFLPPAGSTDVLNYASYGRIAVLGHSPYITTPAQLLRWGDPVGLLTPVAWRSMPTIYGPVATAAQWAAAEIGGGSMARIVFWIRFGKMLAFLATGATLLKLAGDGHGPSELRRLRVGLLWTANPLMAFWLVGSGHVDVFLALLAAAALLAIRRGGVSGGAGAGVLAGAAIAVKFTFAIVAVGLIWPVRRSVAAILGGVGAATATVGISYLWPGATSTTTMTRRLAAGARFIFYLPHSLAARPALLSALVLAATAGVAMLLLRGLPAEDADIEGVRPMLALAIASIVVLPVQTPWYDALIFVLLALMPASNLDYLLIARCLLLTELVLPGAGPDTGTLSTVAAVISHAGLFFLLAVLVIESVRGRWGLGPVRARAYECRVETR